MKDQINSCINMLIALTQLSANSSSITLSVVLDDAAQKQLSENISIENLLTRMKDVIRTQVAPAYISALKNRDSSRSESAN